MSNILDSELNGRKPIERPHGKVVGTTVMYSKLLLKVCKGVEAFLVFSVAALYFAIMPRRVRADELVAYSKLSCRCSKQRREISLAVGEPVGKFETVIRFGHIPPECPGGHTTLSAFSGNQQRSRRIARRASACRLSLSFH